MSSVKGHFTVGVFLSALDWAPTPVVEVVHNGPGFPAPLETVELVDTVAVEASELAEVFLSPHGWALAPVAEVARDPGRPDPDPGPVSVVEVFVAPHGWALAPVAAIVEVFVAPHGWALTPVAESVEFCSQGRGRFCRALARPARSAP